MKVALYQMNIVWENKEENFGRVEEKIREAYNHKTDLFLLPEMSFTGFSMNTRATKEKDYTTLERMKCCSKQYHMALGVGWVKDCGEKSENHYTIIGKDGDILSDYVKIHPFSYSGEDSYFLGGNSISVFSVEGIKMSNFICYDLRFPEIFQIVSKTASVILVPANWPKARCEHWKCLLRARAIENQVYILGINCVGNINGIDYSGDSCIIDPNGQILMELTEQEGILEYELKDDVQEIRERFPIKKDRKEEIYNMLR